MAIIPEGFAGAAIAAPLYTFEPGKTLAYFDSFHGLIPCRIERASVAPSGGWVFAVRFTSKRGAYQRGELFTEASALRIVPRGAVYVKRGTGGSWRIRPYRWERAQ